MDLPLSLISGSINRGDVLLSSFQGIEHKKYFVVMGISEDKVCGFFLINSNININVIYKQELFEMQYPLKHRDYKFLSHDSFVCATDVKEITLKKLSDGIASEKIKIVDRLKESHVREILDMVNDSKIISRRNKLRYFQV